MRAHAVISTALVLACASTPAAAAISHVAVTNNIFTPAEVHVRSGDSVQWTNSGFSHNVLADDNSFRCANGCDDDGGNGAPAPGPWSFTRKFSTPGSFPYHCEVHGFAMSGTVVVEPAEGNIAAAEIVETLSAFDFEVDSGSSAPVVAGTGMAVSRGISGGPNIFASLNVGLHVPAGSALTRLEIEGCVNTGTSASINASLLACSIGTANCSLPLATVQQLYLSSATECGVFQASINGATIDNLNKTYFVNVYLAVETGEASYRSVRVFYQRQVGAAPANATFADVPPASLYFQYVEALAAAAATTGCDGSNFCPDNPVTRAQLALILARLMGLAPN